MPACASPSGFTNPYHSHSLVVSNSDMNVFSWHACPSFGT